MDLKTRLKAVYAHIGGEAQLRSVLLDFYERMSRDTMIGFFFEGKDLQLISSKQAEFLLRAMGFAASYSGRAPAQAHLGLPPILPGHFNRRLRILEETLQAHGLRAEDIRTWIAFESSFRGAIVS